MKNYRLLVQRPGGSWDVDLEEATKEECEEFVARCAYDGHNIAYKIVETEEKGVFYEDKVQPAKRVEKPANGRRKSFTKPNTN